MRIGRLRDAVLTLSFLFLLVLIAARLQEGVQQSIAGPFFVVDGDTLAAEGERLRIAGMDAPEIDQTCARDGQAWDCGQEAKTALRQVMARGKATCHGSERDRYGRLLVDCFVDGRPVAGAMVGAGMAVATGMITYQKEQSGAKAERKGIWGGAFVMPAEWRRQRMLKKDADGLFARLRALLSLQWL
ncbi:thermonuclease family protein [Neorhizobium sp. NPDC001467]|uniref:thermonuclease family protein n=1 Tax=Neorhizobium sp. NPDC001467 TaxID=3390595 RepID=UPI003D058684